MIESTYRIIHIGEKKRLLIDFKDNKYEILSTFLEIDVMTFEDWIKNDFDLVLSGQLKYKKVNGNVCGAEIMPTTTKVFDNFAEDGMGNWCEIDTKELRILIDEWCDKYHEFQKMYHK